jgi:hypothetical protein
MIRLIDAGGVDGPGEGSLGHRTNGTTRVTKAPVGISVDPHAPPFSGACYWEGDSGHGPRFEGYRNGASSGLAQRFFSTGEEQPCLTPRA